ncbi:MAG TPA: hypothetical protein VIH90_06530 [Candidatus Saccharimonadales bacterium]
MRLSNKQISELKIIFEEIHGVILSNEQAQAEGLAVVRFVSAKELRNIQLNDKEDLHNGTDEE